MRKRENNTNIFDDDDVIIKTGSGKINLCVLLLRTCVLPTCRWKIKWPVARQHNLPNPRSEGGKRRREPTSDFCRHTKKVVVLNFMVSKKAHLKITIMIVIISLGNMLTCLCEKCMSCKYALSQDTHHRGENGHHHGLCNVVESNTFKPFNTFEPFSKKYAGATKQSGTHLRNDQVENVIDQTESEILENTAKQLKQTSVGVSAEAASTNGGCENHAKNIQMHGQNLLSNNHSPPPHL